MSRRAKNFERTQKLDEETSDSSPGVPTSTYEPKRYGFWTRMGCTPKSFRRQEGRESTSGIGMLSQAMKPRHLHMIAIGGSIGAGFFVGSGSALRKGGPATLVIDFLLMGAMIFNVVYALGELAVMYPVSGGFYTYSTRFIDPSWGFAMGWNYVLQWAVVLPLELVIAGFTIKYWGLELNVGVWITVFLLFIIFVNVFGVLGYAEEEFWASLLKLSAIVIFMIIALILVLGGGPNRGIYTSYWGAKLWNGDEGAFRHGFQGVCSVFVTAAFAFSGTELVGLAGAESINPVKALPGAVKQVFWRITLFYVVGLLFVGLLVSADDQRLLGSGSIIDVATSPFVIIAKDAGLYGFDSFMNIIILISVVSIANSGVYGGSRTLTALAEQGYAPKMFTYIDRAGRPLFSTVLIIACGGLAYIDISTPGPVIFDWLQALSGLAALFTWGSICLAHIRFRAAWKMQGHTLDEIPFKAMFGVGGSYFSLVLIILVLIAQFYTALVPLGGTIYDANAQEFFKSYLALPVVILFWIIGFFWKRTGLLATSAIDLDTGRREIDWGRINSEKQAISAYPAWRRVVHFLF